MFGLFRTDSRAPRGRFVAALALGAVVATTVSPSTALAQRRQQQQQPANTPEFAKVYQPVAEIANAETGDFAAAKAQIPAIVAAIGNQQDRYMAGNMIVVLGGKLNDRTLQRQGLELMLASGGVPAEQQGQFQFILGGLAYDAKDFAAARTALAAAQAAGHVDDSIAGLTAESYFGEGQYAAGLDYLSKQIAEYRAAGKPVPAAWAGRGLRMAYEHDKSKLGDWSALLVSTDPSAANWATVLNLAGNEAASDKQAQLDVFRLMRMADAMKERREFVGYIEAADPRIMSNEVGKVLDAAVAAGVLTTGDQYYTEVKRIVDQRAPEDRRDAPSLIAEARQSGASGDAINAGDVLYSLEQFAEAEEMYRLAADKGGADRDRALTRLGMAQVHQGKLDAAKATFAQVTTGTRAPIARLWQAYIETKA